MRRTQSVPENIYGKPQVNLHFASKTWYQQRGARGLHKRLLFQSAYVPPEHARGADVVTPEHWDSRHHVLYSKQNAIMQTNTRTYFDRRRELPNDKLKRGESAPSRLVPTWSLGYDEDGAFVGSGLPAHESMRSTWDHLGRPAWSARHKTLHTKGAVDGKTARDVDPSYWNDSNCHGMRTYFGPGMHLPAFPKGVL